MDIRAVSFLRGSRSTLIRLILGSAAFAAAAGFARAESPAPAAPTETLLYSFKGTPGISGPLDGAAPGAGLTFDSKGALYGTTVNGGGRFPFGNGMVFRLTPAATIPWTETVLHIFAGNDGAHPVAGLIFDSKGALYGTTKYGGGTSRLGTAFKLTPPAAGHTRWTETVLYSFKGGSDGGLPVAGLIFDSKGALYGTTSLGGGAFKKGTAFKLMPPGAGQTRWTETVLYRFKFGNDGNGPLAGLIFDRKGALYGTTAEGGEDVSAGTQCSS